jgi:hypothetical protein
MQGIGRSNVKRSTERVSNMGDAIVEIGGFQYAIFVLALFALVAWFIVNTLKKQNDKMEEQERKLDHARQVRGKEYPAERTHRSAND